MTQLKICLATQLIMAFLFLVNTALCQSDFWVRTGGPPDTVVNSIAFDTTNNVYAATNRGIYRSTDHGNHWTLIGLADSIVASVAVDRDGQVFAGTTDPNEIWGDLFRSTDDGAHWIKVILDSVFQSGRPILCLAVDEFDHVLAGGYDVYRSADKGIHWTKSSLNLRPLINSIVPVPGGLIFFAQWGGLYRSSDNGISWDKKNPSPDDTAAVAVGFDQTGYIYAVVYGKESGMYRSGDNGETWQLSTEGITKPPFSITSNALDQVFTGTLEGGVFRTVDNGDSWQPVNTGLTNLDVKCLAVSSDGYLYAGTNGGGVFRSAQSTLGVKRISKDLPQQYGLDQNYPNPFNPTTTIKYTLPRAGHVTLKIYDILGREIATLVNGTQEAGYKSVEFTASGLASGIYFYRLQAGAYVDTKKLLLLK